MRPLGPALRHALVGKCPKCGEGKLFARFLRTVDRCSSCGEEWHRHSADDLPAYLVVLLLGHILVPLMIEMNFALAIPMGVQFVLWPGLAVLLAAALIQPAKAAVIAFQWSRRLHGFGGKAR